MCGFQLGGALVDNLLGASWSPRGVVLLESSGLLGVCVEYMLQQIRQGMQVRGRHWLPVSVMDYRGTTMLLRHILVMDLPNQIHVHGKSCA